MKPKKYRVGSDDRQVASLASLAREIPNIDSAIAEIARLAAELTLPQGTIHVISDIHGEDKKLRHVINNASGTLRPLVEGLLKGQMPAEDLQQFLTLVFYPAEVVAKLEVKLRTAQAQKQFAMKTLRALSTVMRALAAGRTLQHAVRLFPRQYRELRAEILHEPSNDREREYVEAIVHELSRRRRVLHLTCRVIRNLGKDRIATLERDLIEDKATRHESKNPYFRLIHELWFCEKILEEFGVDSVQGMIVNGHVPVQVEKGESPLKKSGKAITIDGAFSEAYGDHGFTLVLEAHRTFLAKHYHFESVEAALQQGADIIPSITVVREWKPPKRVADGQRGRMIRCLITPVRAAH